MVAEFKPGQTVRAIDDPNDRLAKVVRVGWDVSRLNIKVWVAIDGQTFEMWPDELELAES